MRADTQDTELTWKQLEDLRATLGEAFYVADINKFEENFANFLSEFRKFYKNTNIGYSYKTNYIPDFCKLVLARGGYAEVVSEMEYYYALKIGVPAKKIIFNGPYKSEICLEEALLAGSIVNIDSQRDLDITISTANNNPDKDFSVALRCNFEINEKSISRFGFDTESLVFTSAIKALQEQDNILLAGLHCHFPDRGADSYRKRIKKLLQLADAVFEDRNPEFLNIGGGFFGDIPTGLKKSFSVPHVEFSEYAEIIGTEMAKRYGGTARQPNLLLEPGTALVANAMRFYCRVIDVKAVRERCIATVSGSIFNISPVARNTNLPFSIVPSLDEKSESLIGCAITGYTCIEGDVLTQKVSEPIAMGDYIVYENIGSYSIVMKPPFILPNVPIIQIYSYDGPVKYHVIKQKETMEYIFQNFEGFNND